MATTRNGQTWDQYATQKQDWWDNPPTQDQYRQEYLTWLGQDPNGKVQGLHKVDKTGYTSGYMPTYDHVKTPVLNPRLSLALSQLIPRPTYGADATKIANGLEANGMNAAAAASQAARTLTSSYGNQITNALPMMANLEALRAKYRQNTNNIPTTSNDAAWLNGLFG